MHRLEKISRTNCHDNILNFHIKIPIYLKDFFRVLKLHPQYYVYIKIDLFAEKVSVITAMLC